ncbi:uncharacterized protein LOC134683600 [Mytilus trossulus]|uniref:uncharacterized protein LOC134683600 n=1 Tax=Mytilus trossulus TaxID=6551 RepID=UPI0030045789
MEYSYGTQGRMAETSSNQSGRNIERRALREQKTESKKKGQKLYLNIINFDGNEEQLRSLLEKVTRRSFPFKEFRHGNGGANCIAEFSSARQIKEALYDFVTHNKKSNIKIIARQELVKRQISTESKLSQHLDKMTNETSDVLSTHQGQIDSIKNRIDQTGYKKKGFMSMDEFNRVEGEVKALKSKLKEMDLQKKEFRDFLQCTIDKLEKVRKTKKIDSEIKMIYSAFQVECARLSSALPMYARRTDIISMVTENKVSILLGETGSGKSTQVAQYMYQAGLANTGFIVCTQPRKIAAISLATHVSQEMKTSVGQLVGYKVGMQIKQSHDTKILYMTDHMLLNECLKDENFSAYSCIIVDEAHERSIYTDLLLGMIKKSINNRPDLRVVITSATIDPAVFVDYFGICPVLSVSGRMFPVDVTGDILTFLTSPLEVERCCNAFENALNSEADFICLPLHGRLQPIEQQKVFDPPPKGKRKIVFATNSAETSITIPGIKYVIDTGVAKEMQFDPKRNISALCVTTITKSSADQRKGRAGRTDAGKCFRLYSLDTYNDMARNSRPEILRVHLGHALLKLMELGVVPLDFDFVQAPPREMMDAAMETLESVGAVSNGKITQLGKWIAKLPIDPKFGGFVHDAIKEDVGIEALILSAGCAAGGSIFYRSGSNEEKNKADKLKVRFCHEGGDLMTMLNVYREWHDQPEKTKAAWCSENSINGKSIRGVRETVNEVLNILKNDLGEKPKFKLKLPSDVDKKLQKMLFKTFSRNICHYLRHEKAGYLVVKKEQQVQLFPASSLKSLGLLPNWIVIEQVLKTSRDFAVYVTTVLDEWIQEAVEKNWLQLNSDSLNKQRVELLVMFEVGEQVFREFVGPRYSKLRELENSFKETSNEKVIILEASKEVGEISLYTQQNCNPDIGTIVTNRVDRLREKMQQDKSEQFFSSTNTGVRVVIGSGLNVGDVLMVDEYKTIFITGIPKFLEERTEEEITKMFERYGKIVKVEKFWKSKNPNNWGKITYEKKEDAERAVTIMREGVNIKARPSVGFQNSDIRGFRTKLQWCRRPSRGFGFVKFTDLTTALRTRITPIAIGGTMVRIKPSKNGSNEVHVANLNPHVNEDVLRQGFMDALGLDPGDIERVSVIRHKVNTPQDMIHICRQRIRKKVEEYVHEGSYDLDLRPPREADFTFLVFVSFSKTEEGLAACAGMDHGFTMNDQIVTMKADLKTSLIIPKLVYTKYCDIVDKLVDKLSRTENVNIQKKELRNGNMVVNLHSDIVETIIKVKADILVAIKGKVMDIDSHEHINSLFTWDGKRLIKTVMDKTDTTVVSDERILSLSVHGKDENQMRAIKMLEEYLKELKTSKSKTVALKGDDKPPGVMKEIMLRYEYDLSKLVQESGVGCIELNHRLHLITLIGKTEAIEKACSLIDTMISLVIKKRQECKLQPSKTRDCMVCFCPIEEGEMYRLEACGHPYCKDCVELQFKTDIKNNTLPLICSGEGCNEFWTWKDISKLSVTTGIPTNLLVKKATNSFVSQNKKAYKYCPTADCPPIYRVTEKERLFSCPECEVRICTAC